MKSPATLLLLAALLLNPTIAPAAPGDLDPLDANVTGGRVLATTVQPDGGTILTGDFTSVLGQPRNNIARLNPDGTLDTVFDPNANALIYAVAIQPDGKILIGGTFNSLQPNGAPTPTSRNYIARLNPDGSLDTAFDPNASWWLYCIQPQPDGKILIGGIFASLQPNGAPSPITRNHVARLNEDGTLDLTFNPNAAGFATPWVHCIALEPDGRILLGGTFTTLQPNGAPSPTTRNNMARLNADGTLDPSFDPNLNGVPWAVVPQPDGKILIGGDFTALQPNGAPSPTTRNRIARLNADGSLDPGFDPNSSRVVNCLALQTDGKILVATNHPPGPSSTFQPNGAPTPTPRNGFARLLSDGSLDPGFDPNTDNYVFSVSQQADGRVLLGGEFTTLQPNGAPSPTSRTALARLENDSITSNLTVPDTTQALWTRGGAAAELSQVSFELSTDGGTNWSPLGPGVRIGTSPNWEITGLSLPNNGSIRARGRNTTAYLNGGSGLIEEITSFEGDPEIAVEQPPANDLTDGLSQTDFGNQLIGTQSAPKTFTVRNDGDGTLGGLVITIDGPHAADFDLDNTGTATSLAAGLDTTFSVSFTPGDAGPRNAQLHIASDDADENPFDITLTGFGEAPTGDPGPLNLNIVGSVVFATALQPDGKFLIGGTFSSILGVPRQNIARINANGTLDTSFDPKANSTVTCIEVQPDGAIILGGFFSSLQPNGAPSPTTRNRIARVHSDGSLDSVFDPNANGTTPAMECILLQPDGKIVIAGNFISLKPNGAAFTTTRRYIARLNPDGTIDPGFDPNPNDIVYAVALQTDGRIVLGGRFTNLRPNDIANTTTRNYIARVHPDGSLDTGFDPNANWLVTAFAIQPDGKILIGGGFGTLQPNGAPSPISHDRFARLNEDGTLDPTSPQTNNYVTSMAFQADGKLVLCGHFTEIQPQGAPSPIARNHIGRLNADGTVDPSFDPNADEWVYTVEMLPDGKILAGGLFTSMQPNGAPSPTARNLFAILDNNPASQSLTTPDPSQAIWSRSGTAPDLEQVTFDLSTDGGSIWTPLGAGTRIGTGFDWRITGLSLPGSGTLRARGLKVSGYRSGSSSLLEQIEPFTFGPEIAVEHPPAGSDLVSGITSIVMGGVVGEVGETEFFNILNTGPGPLTGLSAGLSGSAAGDYTVEDSALGSPLPSGSSAIISVTFSPTAPGARPASLEINSNDADENPFVINLAGLCVTYDDDSDGDGLNDGAEIALRSYGFDWQVNQAALVNSLFTNLGNSVPNLNAVGFYTQPQLQALYVGTPMIARDPGAGTFTVTIAVEQSTDLVTLTPLPMTLPEIFLNAAGELEFEFTAPDNAAFYLIRSK